MKSFDRTADQLSIERLLASLDDAWARGDAGAFASRFANDGTFTNFLGMFFQGRDAFRERHAAVFRTVFKGTTLKLHLTALRLIRPDYPDDNPSMTIDRTRGALGGLRTVRH